MDIKIILCQNKMHCKHYFRQELTHPNNEEKKYRSSPHFLELANDEERVIFVTPDNSEKIRGLTVKEVIEMGSPWLHENYNRFLDELKARLR